MCLKNLEETHTHTVLVHSPGSGAFHPGFPCACRGPSTWVIFSDFPGTRDSVYLWDASTTA